MNRATVADVRRAGPTRENSNDGGPRMYAAFRIAAYVVILLMAIAMVYAWAISLVNWPGIGV